MEGKKLFYNTKPCNLTVCGNYHMAVVEKIETNIVVLFDIHALNNRIIPKSTSISEATHMQYMDINGTIHIIPMNVGPPMLSDVVNFRLLTSTDPFTFFQSIETSLEPVIDIYEKHLVKPCLEVRYDRHFTPR